MTIDELKILLEKYHQGNCTSEERAFIDALLNRLAERSTETIDEDEKATLLNKVREEIGQRTGVQLSVGEAGLVLNKRPSFLKRYWRGSAAAAAAVLVILIGSIAYYNAALLADNKQYKPTPITTVQPGTISASLLLANGKRISLDSAQAGDIRNIQVQDGYVCLLAKNGRQVSLNKAPNLNIYNVLMTGRGQQAPPMVLSDGTKIWLNDASVLRFPIQFTGNTREVLLTGEAYFEVAKDESRPFIVKAGENNVKVLGTHFDVMAYDDEPYVYATLLEGSILINNNKGSAKLVPGQQGVISGGGDIAVKSVNADLSVAWLHGKLPMDNMEVHAFLREVSRWYDVDIVYKGKISSQAFSGNLDRSVPLAYVLSALRANGVNCELKGKTIIVSE